MPEEKSRLRARTMAGVESDDSPGRRVGANVTVN